MTIQPVATHRLTLQLEKNIKETIVHCAGRISAENSEMLQREIRNLIAEVGAQGSVATHRVVLELSNVTHVDSSGLGALLGAWTAAKKIRAATSKWKT